MRISVSQPVRNIGIAVFAGIAIFAHLPHLNVITSIHQYFGFVVKVLHDFKTSTLLVYMILNHEGLIDCGL